VIGERAPEDNLYQGSVGTIGPVGMPGPTGMYKNEYRSFKIIKILNKL